MPNIVIFSDDIFYIKGILTSLLLMGVNVYSCTKIDEIHTLPVSTSTLYIVAVEDFYFRKALCEVLGSMKNVLHIFDIPKSNNSTIKYGYISKRLTWDRTWSALYSFVKSGYTQKISLSLRDVFLIKNLAENSTRRYLVKKGGVRMTDKSIHTKKYVILKKFGFCHSRPVNLLYCYTLICFRYGIHRDGFLV